MGTSALKIGVLKPLLPPEYFHFDIVAIYQGLHHFESPPLAVRCLAARLKTGSGVLLFTDFLPFELDKHHLGHHNPGHHQPGHHQQHGGHLDHDRPAHAITTSGSTRDEMRKLYKDAGMGADYEFDMLPEPAVMGDDKAAQRRKLFIAKGRQAAKQ